MLDVALVTCTRIADGDEDDHLLAGALTRLGVSVAFVCWDDPDARWPAAGMAVVRSTWDYHERLDAFLGWADWVGSVTTLRNDAATIRSNSHKGYLLDLEAHGVPIVPTRLVEPYVDAIETKGELSIVCIDGGPSHVVRKVPARGDFRTQEHHGAIVNAVELDDRHRALALAALSAVETTPLYARVDAVDTDDGFLLMELELIEPTLWLRWHPPAADVLAAAIVAQLA